MRFLENILGDLRHHGLIESRRGAEGGYWLSRPPQEITIGEVMRAAGIARVAESRNPHFAVDDEVYGVFGVQRYALSDGRGVTPVDTTLAPAPVHLGVLGISGLTAYFGLLDISRPEPGQTVVISGAAGRWAVSRDRSHGSRVAGRSVSPAARRSVAGWARSSGLTPPSTSKPLNMP